MKVAVGSAFRNSSANAMRYLERVRSLREHLTALGHTVRVIAVEGDSADNTRQALAIGAIVHDLDLDLRTCNHGGPVFGSTEQPERMVALSKVGNAIFDGVRPDDDVLVYVESDLQWDAETIVELIHLAHHQVNGFDIFAPMIAAGTAFYDTWGFRGRDGERWGPFWPMHPDVKSRDDSFVGMNSVGSCLVMRGEVARATRITNDYCLVGWCENARANGYWIAAVLGLTVRQA